MKKIQNTLFCLLLLFATPLWLTAQKNFTLSGYIKDKSTGETLIGANIYDKNNPTLGATTNAYGYYILSLPEGAHSLAATFVGYTDWTMDVTMNKDLRLNVDLGEGVEMKAVVVTAEQKDRNVESTQMGTVELPLEQVKKLPALMGEVDILKSLQLLPGVMSAGEGNSGFYVRGGGADQNLVLLDEATVYNTGHLLGFFSVFNADALKSTTLIKGNMPANYGGRLSSVVDVSMRDGNNQNFAAEGGIGAISSRLTLEGPIVKDKASFMVSGRRTYAFDVAQPFIQKTNFKGTNYYFYDLNLKANYKFSDRDRVYLSGYFGRDVLRYKSEARGFDFSMPWGNATGTLRWNHLFSDRLFMNASVVYNDYDFTISAGQKNFEFKLFSGIKDWNGKLDFTYHLNNKHKLSFGANYTYHTFIPNVSTVSVGETVYELPSKKKYAHESAVYLLDDWKVNNKLAINMGLRFSAFTQVGPYTSTADGAVYKTLEPVKTYTGLEPRVSFKYSVRKDASIKGGVSYNKQYIHLVSNSTSTFPSDLWVPSTERTQPQASVQYATGYFQNFHNNDYETSVEVYYKDLFNQIDYAENYVPRFATDTETQFVYGRGRAYGLELFLKKRTGKLNGWVGYTLSRSERRFQNENPDFAIADGKWFPSRFDRTHDISVAVNYDLNKQWSFGGVFVYGTGNAFTAATDFYLLDGQLRTNYGPRNGSRIQEYHRLDVSATWTPKTKNPNPNFESSWNFSIYNVYNNLNTFLTYYDQQVDLAASSAQIKYYKVTLFPIIPSVTWNFKWKKIGKK